MPGGVPTLPLDAGLYVFCLGAIHRGHWVDLGLARRPRQRPWNRPQTDRL